MVSSNCDHEVTGRMAGFVDHDADPGGCALNPG
jgi:hypothetical protein